MQDLPVFKRNYQAEVHFALGAVIQGITVAALGNELATALRDLQFPGSIWVFITGVQSLLMCIAFWYTFMNNYFFGFRVINLTARDHFLLASQYLILGLLQLIAIQFLAEPRLWLTFYLMLIATVLIGSAYTSRIAVITKENVRQAMEYDPGTKAFLIASFLSLGSLTLWYVIPGIDTGLFRAIALAISGAGLVLFTVNYVRVFQKHLDVE